MTYGVLLNEGCIFYQCSHVFFFFSVLSSKSRIFRSAGGSNSSMYKFVGELNIGLVREHVPTSHVKTIPALGLHTDCCRELGKKCLLMGEKWMDELIEVISHAEIRDKHRRKTACLCMIIISGGSWGILSEAGVIPLIKSTYRILSWLRPVKAQLMTSWTVS